MDVISANWRILLVFLVVVIIALKELLRLDDTTINQILTFVAGGATASAAEGVVRKTQEKNAEKAANADPGGPPQP